MAQRVQGRKSWFFSPLGADKGTTTLAGRPLGGWSRLAEAEAAGQVYGRWAAGVF